MDYLYNPGRKGFNAKCTSKHENIMPGEIVFLKELCNGVNGQIGYTVRNKLTGEIINQLSMADFKNSFEAVL